MHIILIMLRKILRISPALWSLLTSALYFLCDLLEAGCWGFLGEARRLQGLVRLGCFPKMISFMRHENVHYSRFMRLVRVRLVLYLSKRASHMCEIVPTTLHRITADELTVLISWKDTIIYSQLAK